MRVLIIEDDKQLSQTMRVGLRQQGFTIDVANDAASGEEKIAINQYDCVLLDLNLPDQDGLDVLARLRSDGNHLPVIIVSARDQMPERAIGLDTGADDYVVKPFDFIELSARIRAVSRRFFGRTNPILQIGDLKIIPHTRNIQFKGKDITLSAKEFDIIEYLASKSPAVVSSEEIAEHVYDEDFDAFSSVLRVHIANLRKKLITNGGENLLQTVKGKGYQLCQKEPQP